MARYILIDHHTGYIWGDTADMPRPGYSDADMTPTLSAQLLDESVGTYGRTYREEHRRYEPAHNETAYHVYRADVNGSEAVPVIHDGQDREMIEAVTRDAEKVAVVVCQTEEA